MRSRKNTSRNHKRGSYILEAAVILPLFLVSLLTLAQIIPVIAACERTVYSCAEEMRLEMGKSAFRKNAAVLPAAAAVRVMKDRAVHASFLIRDYRYLYSDNGIDDLITIRFLSSYHIRSPLGLYGKVRLDGHMTCRGFTGTYYHGDPSGEDDFASDEAYDPVYIFPNWGKCYHSKNCTYVKANCFQTYLTGSIQRKYHPCPLCGARSLPFGAAVFCFGEAGEAYHTAGCTSVKRYYIEIDRSEAIRKGYSACSKCGG